MPSLQLCCCVGTMFNAQPSVCCTPRSAPLFADVAGEVVLAPHCQVTDLLSIDGLIVIGDLAYHHCVVSKRNNGVGVNRGHTVVKRARPRLFLLRRLKHSAWASQILKTFYSCTIESILTGCITAWYGNCLASYHKALQRVVLTAH